MSRRCQIGESGITGGHQAQKNRHFARRFERMERVFAILKTVEKNRKKRYNKKTKNPSKRR
jgi:uncharacterized protein YdcH (DUF465 family)